MARGMDRRKCLGLDVRLAGRAGTLQPMQDIALGLTLIEWPDMASGRDSLSELLHFRTLQDLAELGLTNEETLQQRVVAELKVGQHAQLLDRARCQVLRLVDYEE